MEEILASKRKNHLQRSFEIIFSLERIQFSLSLFLSFDPSREHFHTFFSTRV